MSHHHTHDHDHAHDHHHHTHDHASEVAEGSALDLDVPESELAPRELERLRRGARLPPRAG